MPIKVNGYDFWRVIDSFNVGDYTTHGYTNKDYSEDLHSQVFYELNIITRGSGVHHFGERTYPAVLGDVFIIPPNILHGYDGGKGFDVYHLLLSPTFIQKNSTSLQRLPAYSTLFHIDPMMRERVSDRLHLRLGERIGEIIPYLQEMERIDKTPTVSSYILSESLATIVITRLCEVYSERSGDAPEEGREDDGFVKSLSYIYEHYDEHIDIEMLVRMANMSRTSYLTHFKRITGTTPIRLQMSRRVEIAKQMLDDRNAPLSAIAQAVGCCDSSHLVKLFVSFAGMTPAEYRGKRVES